MVHSHFIDKAVESVTAVVFAHRRSLVGPYLHDLRRVAAEETGSLCRSGEFAVDINVQLLIFSQDARHMRPLIADLRPGVCRRKNAFGTHAETGPGVLQIQYIA